MAASPIYDRVLESTTTTGEGTLTLSGPIAGYRSFSVIGNGNTTPMAIWEVDASGNASGAWEVADKCTYTSSGTTLSRGTFKSSSTGSVISFGAGTKRVGQVLPAAIINNMVAATRGHIQGLQVSWSSTTAIAIAAGELNINGTVRTFAGATYTSATTMKNIANSTVTIGASKAYWLFAFNVAGTVRIAIEEIDGTGDGAALVFDTALDYWKAASTGAEARRIGKFFTDGSSLIVKFFMVGTGRVRQFPDAGGGVIALVPAGVQTSFTVVTMTPYISADDEQVIVSVGVGHSTEGTSEVDITMDNSGLAVFFRVAVNNTAVSYSGTVNYLKNTGDMRYRVLSGDTCEIYLAGFQIYA